MRVDDLPAGKIRAADIADFALTDQVVERAQGFLDRRERIGLVQLIEIDPIGARRRRLSSTSDMM